MDVQLVESNGNTRVYSGLAQKQSYQSSSTRQHHSRVSRSSYSESKSLSANQSEISAQNDREKRVSLHLKGGQQIQGAKCKANSDAASISSVSDTDDSFVWRADAGSSIGDSDHEILHSNNLMDSYIKALEERGVMNPGDMQGQPAFTESTTTSKVVSGNKVTKTTKTVVKSSNYQTINGHEEEPEFNIMARKSPQPIAHQRGNSVSSTTSSLRNGYANDRLARSGSNASSIASGRGLVDPNQSGFSTVATSVLADGSLVTTYTSRTTTVHEEPTQVIRQQYVSASPVPSASYISDSEGVVHSRQHSLRSNHSQSYQTSSTLPRQPIPAEYEVYTPPRSATLPRPTENYHPVAASTPDSQVHEEERINPDGSRVYIRKVVTTTTTCTTEEPEDEFVEVTIAPKTETSFEETRRQEINESEIGRFDRVSTSSIRSDKSERSQRSVTPRPAYLASSGPGYVRPSDGRYVEEQITTTTSVVHGENDTGSYHQRSRTPSHSTDVENERMTRATYERSSNRSTDARVTPKPRAYDVSADPVDETVIRTTYRDGSAQHVISGVSPPRSSPAPQNSGYVVEERVTTKKTVTVEEEPDEIKKRPPSYGDYEDAPQHGYEIDLLDLLMFLKTDDDILKANAAGYIMHLCYNDEAIKIKMRELDLIPLLVRLLDHQEEDCHRNAAGALKNLSYGRFLDDNKAAIQECGGIPASVRLLYRTNSLEVREHVSGILYNLSSSTHIKAEILDDAVEAVSVLIIIPLSGWEKRAYLEDRPPNMVIWSVLLRNATGVLRNVSSIGPEAREKLRRQEGLVDALVWMLRAAIAQDKNDIDNKIVENTICILRNISYRLDQELDRELYPDAIKVISEPDEEPTVEFRPAKKPKEPTTPPEDASTTGCIFMKKKPPGSQKRKLSFKKKNSKQPQEPVEQYRKPEKKDPILGLELLWEPETVSLYIYLIDKSNNSFTLEAACGAVHNLCAGNWNWAALLRAHIRRERGLPPINELLTVQQEYIVRAAALALRNLAIDKKNKGLIGRYAMKELLTVIPPPSTPQGSLDPTDYTIATILGTIGVVLHGNLENCQIFKNHGGIGKVMALTREPDPKREKPLRIYSQRVVLEANRVLLYTWEFKEIQGTIKKGFWSYSKAVEEERAYKNATLKQPKRQGDVIAEMEEENRDTTTLPRDNRRFVTVEDEAPERRSSIEKPPASPTTPTFDVIPPEAGAGDTLEMKPVHRPPTYVDDEPPPTEDKPLLANKNVENDAEIDERTPLYAKVDKKKKIDNDGKVADGGKADSWV